LVALLTQSDTCVQLPPSGDLHRLFSTINPGRHGGGPFGPLNDCDTQTPCVQLVALCIQSAIDVQGDPILAKHLPLEHINPDLQLIVLVHEP